MLDLLEAFDCELSLAVFLKLFSMKLKSFKFSLRNFIFSRTELDVNRLDQTKRCFKEAKASKLLAALMEKRDTVGVPLV